MTPRVSDQHKEARRGQILDAAAHCFAQKGYAVTTMQDIFHEAGVSAGAVYSYFGAKEEIFLALAARDLESDLRRVQGALAAESTAWGRLERFLRFFMPAGFQEPLENEFYRLYLLEFLPSAPTNPQLRDYLNHRARRLHQLLVDVLRAGMTQGEFRSLDADAVAALIVAAGDGLRLHALTLGTLAPADVMDRSWLESVRQAVRG